MAARDSFRLDISLDRKNLARLDRLASLSKSAAARALTSMAAESIDPWRAANKRVFHMRRAWINRGLRFIPATPGNLNAQVGTLDKYMGRHVVGLGEEKRARAGGKLLVPFASIQEQGTHNQLRARLRRADSSARKIFKLERGGKTYLMRRKGKARGPLELVAVLTDHVKIPERLDALGIVGDVVNRRFGAAYERLLIRAWEGQSAT